MKSRLAAVFVLACVATAGCDVLGLGDKTKDSGGSSTPTTPTTPTVAMDAFAGTWQSTAASTPPTGCGNLKYTVTPTGTNSANVSFTATCAGSVNVTGSGSGTLAGSVITWGASGLVGQGGVNCPFTFANNTATLDAPGQVTVNYTGTVCGIPVSGTETVKK
jgi:hypothetical protein